ncbi:nuclear transport factor 2 family protein [Rhodococcus jostii]|uniref:SnoaL-like domain-containing protein n=1 Tax=Rhodococcus jostii TaxID=132919 RepID=A0A1H5CZZ2_RHOJO|nr:nuclear transport factor 2 family protein [Rhodococcus jostii]SED72094.1 SnoaL-like domain-containing protein [Rhodococcus jostii]
MDTTRDDESATGTALHCALALHSAIETVTQAWERALAAHDLDALLACYAPDATVESPVVAHLEGGRGVRRGHDELRPFLAEVVARTPDIRHYHRDGFFTDGRRATWEYPRVTPDGEQMDFVEVMEIEDGLIQAHRVYWGWRGVDVLIHDGYHRE